MFDVRPMPSQLPQELIAKALGAEPATIGHFRLMGLPDPRIRQITPCPRIAGTAVTLALPGGDSTLLHHAAGLLRPGDLLVIDRLGDTVHAAIGGAVAKSLAAVGICGLVLDGPYADPGEVRESGLAVWATGLSSKTTRLMGHGGVMNAPVSIGGAVVQPGDLVIADEGGVVFLPPSEAERDITRATQMQAAEAENMPRVYAGLPLGELTGASALVQSRLV